MTYNEIYKKCGKETANIAQFFYARDKEIEISQVKDIPLDYVLDAQSLILSVKPESGSPAVYVSTYGKYNRGSLLGLWIDLACFSTADEYFEFIRALHSDEADPEFMVQDYNYFPEEWYSESMGRETVERLIEYASWNDGDRDVMDAYIDYSKDKEATLKEAKDALYGRFDSDEECAERLFREQHHIPDDLEGFINWKRVTECMLDGMTECNGYYFW